MQGVKNGGRARIYAGQRAQRPVRYANQAVHTL